MNRGWEEGQGEVLMDRELPLHADVAGEGPPVVFLHGFLGTSKDWDAVTSLLEADYQVIRVDLPGHGRSLRVRDAAYALIGAADAVIETVSALTDESVVLVGYSMGGRVALTAALRYPNRLTALGLLSASTGIATAEKRAGRLVIDRARADRIRDDLPGFLAHWYRMPLFRPLAEASGGPDGVASRCVSGDPDELARALEALSPGHQPDAAARLAELGLPILVMAGALDARYAAQARRLRVFETVTAAVIEKAGHSLHLEAPEAVVHHLRLFLQSRA